MTRRCSICGRVELPWRGDVAIPGNGIFVSVVPVGEDGYVGGVCTPCASAADAAADFFRAEVRARGGDG